MLTTLSKGINIEQSISHLLLILVWVGGTGVVSANTLSPVTSSISAAPLTIKQQFTAAKVSLNRIYVSPNGQSVVTASDSGVASLWSLTGDPLSTMDGQKPPMFNARFSPNGQTIVTTGYDGTIRLWNTQGKLLKQRQPHQAAVTDILIFLDDKFIVTSSDDGQTQIFNRDGIRLAEIIKPGTARNLAYTTQGNLIASAYDSGTVYVINPNGEIQHEIGTGQGRINNVRFSPNGKQILTSGINGTAKLWQLSGQLLAELKASSIGWVNSAAFHPNGRLIATASDDGILRLWQTNAKLVYSMPLGENNKLTSLDFSSDGKKLAVVSNKGQVWIVDVSN